MDQPLNNTGYVQGGGPPPDQPYIDASAKPPTALPPELSYEEYKNYNYDYNMKNVQYQQIDVGLWGSIPNDPSPYSQYWNPSDAFEPHNFSNNIRVENSWRDLGFLIAFWINFAITLVLTIVLLAIKTPDTSGDEGGEVVVVVNALKEDSEPTVNVGISTGKLAGVLIIAFVFALLFSFGHLFYAAKLPLIYIRFSLFIGCALALIFCLVLCFTAGVWLILILPAILVGIAFLCFCITRARQEFSAAVLSHSVTLIFRYPSILLLTLVECVVLFLVNLMFFAFAYLTSVKQWSGFVYIYIVLSYFWTAYTFTYVSYMTGAGVASTWYFLDGTAYFPKNPVWESFKRASTKSFGSAAYAALIIAILETLRWLAKDGNNDNPVIAIIKCIIRFIIMVIEMFMKWLNRYALIYCATFGIPYKEGCRRWMELSFKRFVNVIVDSSIIEMTVSVNMLMFVTISAVLSALIGYLIGSTIGAVIGGLCGFIFTFLIFKFTTGPLEVYPDTIFVCFAEDPNRLRTFAPDLYSRIDDVYRDNIRIRMG